MSVSFDGPPNKEALAAMRAFFGSPAASDEKTFLFNNLPLLEGDQLSKIARHAEQPVTMRIHGNDEIKTLSDGTQYKVTPRGWVKV